MSNALPFAQHQARSYQNLDSARRNAAKKNRYNSSSTRAQLTDLFHARFGSNPYDWQLDVTEAILLDSVIIAGTGSGKKIFFKGHFRRRLCSVSYVSYCLKEISFHHLVLQ